MTETKTAGRMVPRFPDLCTCDVDVDDGLLAVDETDDVALVDTTEVVLMLDEFDGTYSRKSNQFGFEMSASAAVTSRERSWSSRSAEVYHAWLYCVDADTGGVTVTAVELSRINTDVLVSPSGGVGVTVP